MNTSDDLLPQLLRPNVSPMDLPQVLLHHFGGSHCPGTSREAHYPISGPCAFRVRFDEYGAPIAAYAGAALTPERWTALLARIEAEFVQSTGEGVNRQAHFTHTPCRGWWRYKDRFQILPVPES